jgi:hypothetical protein
MDEFELLNKMYDINNNDQQNKNNNKDNKEEECNEDINEYSIAEDQDGIIFLNVFFCYYKQLFNKDEDTSIFHDIEYDKPTSTNRAMEFMYDHVKKYNSSKPESKKIYDVDKIDIKQFDEIYLLTINGIKTTVSPTLVPIIKYISEFDDWQNLSWSINPLK